MTYNGKYYQLDEAPLNPAGYEGRKIEILIGGAGEKRTLRTVASCKRMEEEIVAAFD